MRDHLRRIVQILRRHQAERHGNADVVQVFDRALQVGARLEGAYFVEQRLHRLGAERVDAALIHARRIEIARQLLRAALRPVGFLRHLGEDVAHMFLVDLAGLPAPAPAVHIVGNRMRRAPGAVGVVEEIVARGAVFVDVTGIDAVLRVSGT